METGRIFINEASDFDCLATALRSHNRVVYTKPPFAGAAHVLPRGFTRLRHCGGRRQAHGRRRARRQQYIEEPVFVRVHRAWEGVLEAMHVELDRVETSLVKAAQARPERHVPVASRFMGPRERKMSVLGEISRLEFARRPVALRPGAVPRRLVPNTGRHQQ